MDADGVERPPGVQQNVRLGGALEPESDGDAEVVGGVEAVFVGPVGDELGAQHSGAGPNKDVVDAHVGVQRCAWRVDGHGEARLAWMGDRPCVPEAGRHGSN